MSAKSATYRLRKWLIAKTGIRSTGGEDRKISFVSYAAYENTWKTAEKMYEYGRLFRDFKGCKNADN